MIEERLQAIPPVRITEVVAAPLFGDSPPGGWSNEIQPTDSIHTLIAVHTDAGVTGYGSVFTDGRLTEAAVAQLAPLFLGENALEPERVSEKLHQNSFWFGRGGTLTHAISGIDIALWDIMGKVTGLPVSMLVGGRHCEKVQPYCSVLMEEPDEMAQVIARYRDQGFRAFKIGWGRSAAGMIRNWMRQLSWPTDPNYPRTASCLSMPAPATPIGQMV